MYVYIIIVVSLMCKNIYAPISCSSYLQQLSSTEMLMRTIDTKISIRYTYYTACDIVHVCFVFRYKVFSVQTKNVNKGFFIRILGTFCRDATDHSLILV